MSAKSREMAPGFLIREASTEMLQKYTEAKTIAVEKSRFVCDLCEAVIDGEIFLRIEPHRVVSHDNQVYTDPGTGHLDICSADCLQKRTGAASLLLNTKLIPEAHAQKEVVLSNTGRVLTATSSSSSGNS